jgi:hypothetical protein
MTRHKAVFAILLSLLWLAVGERPAHAWVEWHHVGETVRLELDRQAGAKVEHQIRYHVNMGPLRTFDVPGIDAAATVEQEGSVQSEDGVSVPTKVELLPLNPKESAQRRTLRVTVLEGKGLKKRGNYTFIVRYAIDALPLFERDGAFAKLTFVTPPAWEGYDSGRLVVRVPAEATAPTSLPDSTVQAKTTRGPEFDELELTRAHVAKGESAVWSVRMDPKAFAARPKAPAFAVRQAPKADHSRLKWLSLSLVAALVAAALFGLVRARAGTALIAIPNRPILVSAVGFASVIVQSEADGLWGAVSAAALGLLLVNRAAGKAVAGWLPVRPIELLSVKRYWDATTLWGALALLCTMLALGTLGYFGRSLRADAQLLAIADAGALACLFLTGTVGAKLRTMARATRAISLEHRITPLGKFTGDGRIADVAMAVSPKKLVPGVVGFELSCPGSYRLTVHTKPGSPASERLGTFARGGGAAAGHESGASSVFFREEYTLKHATARIRSCVELLSERRSRQNASKKSRHSRRETDFALL